MAVREDVITNFSAEPERVAEVAAPSTEFTAQDIVDTLRVQEASFQGISHPSLLDAFGKQDLGGGVQVGITVELQDTKVAFEGRTNPAQTGTVTSVSVSPISNTQQFVDTSANFVTAAIARGSLLINFTDESIAEVTDIVSATELRTKTLVNGTTNTYTIADSYQIFNITQCKVGGGNVVAVDENAVSISQVLPTAFTQVVTTSSSSATLLNQFALEHGSYDGAVWVNPTSPYSGSDFPVGTLLQPVNNMVDALTIATNEGFGVFNILGSITIPAVGDFSNKAFRGPVSAVPVTIAAGAMVDNCDYEVLQLSGELGGSSLVRDCLVANITGFNGIMENSVISGSVACAGSNESLFVNCYSSIDVTTLPEIHFGGASGPDIALRGYVGDIKFADLSRPAGKISIDFESGDLIVDSTVSSGTVVVRGIGTLTDNSTGNAVVISKILNADNVNNSLFDGGVTVDAISGIPGTEFPIGTRSNPVSNLADAKIIAANESINEIRFLGNYTFSGADDLNDYVIRGEGPEATLFTLTSGVTTDNTLFLDADITGVCGGYTRIRDCEIKTSLSNIQGLFENCIFRVGTYTLIGDNTKLFVANNCKSGVVTGQPQPIFDCNGDGASFIVRAWSGPYTTRNKTAAVSGICFDFISGKLILDSTITAGHFPVRGTVYVINNTTGTATVELEGVGSARQNTDFIWGDPATNFDETGTTGNWLNEIHGQIRRGVFINTEEVTNGNGYQQTPYNNFSDAVDSAESLFLQKLFLEADATVDRQLSNFEIEGIDLPTVDLNGQDFKNTIIRECNITGAQGTGNSPLLLLTCGSNNVTDFNGSALTLAATGTFGIADGAFVLINEVVNAVAGVFTNIDMGAGGAASNLNMMKVMGDFQISNMDNASDTIDIGFQAGELTVNSSCTAGTIVVHGNCVLIDNSGPGCTVVLDHVDPLDVLLSKELLEADQVFDQSAGLLHYYRKGTTTDLIPPKTVVTTQTQDTSLKE
jgi:hypothetical protein